MNQSISDILGGICDTYGVPTPDEGTANEASFSIGWGPNDPIRNFFHQLEANRKITVPKVSVLGNYKYACHLTTTKKIVLIRGGQIRWEPRELDSFVHFNK